MRIFLLGVSLLLAGCASIPDTYAPPVQRKPLTGPEPSPIAHFADMADANADAHIVRDISRATESKTWRWTGQKPELRFLLTTTENLKFSMDFAVPEITFAQRGPVSISIFVNDRLLDTVRCEKGGERHFEKPVPPEWLRTHLPNLVVAEIDKVWVSPGDGAKLGFILSRAGFVQ